MSVDQVPVKDLDKLPEDLRPEKLTTITKQNMTAFFSRHSKLSNHYPCKFTHNGVSYSSVEQCLMHNKAMLFGDHQTATAILKCTDPADAKFLGRKVQNYNHDAWRKNRDHMMMSAVEAKFTQNKVLTEFLKNTGHNILIEANPHDKYWGIGQPLHDANIWKQDLWNGHNKLGYTLMETRAKL